MQSGYLITVLIPCHSLQYLPKSIKSISQQTFPHDKFEVLVVADRIDSGEARKILRASGLNYRIIQSLKPGIVPALNIGLANIDSEFVARMDEDDLMRPKRLELQYRHMLRNKRTSVVGGQLQLIDVDDKVIGISSYRKKIYKPSAHTLQRSPIAHPAAMFRRRAVEQIGGYRDFLPEDWDLWIRLSEYGPIENLKEIVLEYRVHPNQLSREKMYTQDLARQFVSTSHFARLSGIRDAPIKSQDKDIWLEETLQHLRLVSKAFHRFEKKSEKYQLINDSLNSGMWLQSFQKAPKILLRFPFVASIYLFTKLGTKIKLSVNKSK